MQMVATPPRRIRKTAGAAVAGRPVLLVLCWLLPARLAALAVQSCHRRWLLRKGGTAVVGRPWVRCLQAVHQFWASEVA